jgi:hypothetical protein
LDSCEPLPDIAGFPASWIASDINVLSDDFIAVGQASIYSLSRGEWVQTIHADQFIPFPELGLIASRRARRIEISDAATGDLRWWLDGQAHSIFRLDETRLGIEVSEGGGDFGCPPLTHEFFEIDVTNPGPPRWYTTSYTANVDIAYLLPAANPIASERAQ